MTLEELDGLYERIDDIAKEADHYDFGLPHDRGCAEDGEVSYQDRILAAIREATAPLEARLEELEDADLCLSQLRADNLEIRATRDALQARVRELEAEVERLRHEASGRRVVYLYPTGPTQ